MLYVLILASLNQERSPRICPDGIDDNVLNLLPGIHRSRGLCKARKRCTHKPHICKFLCRYRGPIKKLSLSHINLYTDIYRLVNINQVGRGNIIIYFYLTQDTVSLLKSERFLVLTFSKILNLKFELL